MDQLTHNVRRSNWINIIRQCQDRPAGTTAKQWLVENDISEKSYYYWLRKFRKEAYRQMQMPPAASSSEITFAIIKNGALSIAISNDISDALLDRIFQVIRHA